MSTHALGSFDEAYAYLARFTNYEKRMDAAALRGVDLSRMARFVERAGRPDRAYRVAHVAGTKGKGSTVEYLAALLGAAGARTGLYTSPHLLHMCERIRVAGRELSPAAFTAALNRVLPILEEARLLGDPLTFFEIVTGMALDEFRAAGCEYGVLEVGLGGRLDATNVVTPDVAAIANLSIDHTQILGDTLEEIAAEKAAIIKPGVPVVAAPALPEARRVVDEAARRAGSNLLRLGDDFHVAADGPRRFVATVRGLSAVRFSLRNPGWHQAENAALALQVYALLAAGDARLFRADAETLGEALSRTLVPARIQLFPGSPPVILDVAHNEASFRALAAVLRHDWPAVERALVFACAADKDPVRLLPILAPLFRRAVFTRFRGPRAEDAERLAAAARAQGVPEVRVAPDAAAALSLARPGAGLVVVTGSFYLAGAVAPLLEPAAPAVSSPSQVYAATGGHEARPPRPVPGAVL
ncbi:MAG: bifunctional folylpolyglutamate synthase/dihydrofolate synthase [Planctomycetes bacterium]|nr:bifunctional folylpolyglutamate synthase/dihydrofolate synthase [Planctomycetota bacterium]